MELYPIVNDPLRERRLERAHERTPASPENNLKMYMLLSELMLWLSLTESKSKRRAARKAFLARRWMQLSGDSLKTPSFPGVLL